MDYQRPCTTFNWRRSAHYNFAIDLADHRAVENQKKLPIFFKKAQAAYKYRHKLKFVKFIHQTVSEKIRLIEPRNKEWID